MRLLLFELVCPHLIPTSRFIASAECLGLVSGVVHGIPPPPFFVAYLSFVVRQIVPRAHVLPYILRCTHIDYHMLGVLYML